MMGSLGRPAVKRSALAVTVVALLLPIAAVCGGSGEKEVTGLVLEVVERDLVEIEFLRLRDDAGRVWEFSTAGDGGASGARLRGGKRSVRPQLEQMVADKKADGAHFDASPIM